MDDCASNDGDNERRYRKKPPRKLKFLQQAYCLPNRRRIRRLQKQREKQKQEHDNQETLIFSPFLDSHKTENQGKDLSATQPFGYVVAAAITPRRVKERRPWHKSLGKL